MEPLLKYLYKISDSDYFFIKTIDAVEYEENESIPGQGEIILYFSLWNRYERDFEIPINISDEIVCKNNAKSKKTTRFYSDRVIDLYTYKEMFGYGDDHILDFKPGEIKAFKTSFIVEERPEMFTLVEYLIPEDDRLGCYNIKISLDDLSHIQLVLRKQIMPYDIIEPENEVEYFRTLREGEDESGEKGLVCPCCGQVVTKEQASRTLAVQIIAGNYLHRVSEQDLLPKYYQWACDSCLESGRAILGDTEQQKWDHQGPYLAYYDIKKKCKACKKEFVFARDEQKYWYETLKFWVQSECNNCPDCRREIRKNKPTQKKKKDV